MHEFYKEQCEYSKCQQITGFIQNRMKEQGVGNTYLARTTGYSRGEVEKFLTGKRPLTVHFADLALDRLGYRIGITKKGDKL